MCEGNNAKPFIPLKWWRALQEGRLEAAAVEALGKPLTADDLCAVLSLFVLLLEEGGRAEEEVEGVLDRLVGWCRPELRLSDSETVGMLPRALVLAPVPVTDGVLAELPLVWPGIFDEDES